MGGWSPESSGQIEVLKFVPGTITDYNKDLASVAQTATNGANAAAAQQQLEAEQQAIDGAAGAVASDISSLSDLSSTVQSYEQSLNADIAALQKDLQAVQADAQTVTNDIATNDGSTCGDVGTAEGDAGSASGDYGSMSGDETSANSSLSQYNSIAESLQSDWAAFQRAQAVLPNYESPDPPTSDQVQSILGNESQLVGQLQAAVATDDAQGQSLLSQANAASQGAQNAATASGQC